MIFLNLTSHAPDAQLRTEVPLTVAVSGEPLETLINDYRYLLIDQQQRHATLPVRPIAVQQQLLLQFHVFLPGAYRVEVMKGKEVMAVLPLNISQQQYLSFGTEFGIFLILLLIVISIGGWIWKQNNKKSI